MSRNLQHNLPTALGGQQGAAAAAPPATSTTHSGAALHAPADATNEKAMAVHGTVDDHIPWSQFVWTQILQIFVVLIALVFGVFTPLTYYTARHANTMAAAGLQDSIAANQLALLVFCQSGESNTGNAIAGCQAVQQVASASIAALATSLLSVGACFGDGPGCNGNNNGFGGPTSTGTSGSTATGSAGATSTPSSSPGPQSGLALDSKIAIAISVPAGLMLVAGVGLSVVTYRTKSRRRQKQQQWAGVEASY